MSQRFDYIDWMKAIGIWLIVLGHVPITNEDVVGWIFSFHVPLFFFISGYLFKDVNNDKLFLWNNFRNLILVTIPYFLIRFLLGTLPFGVLSHNSFDNICIAFSDSLFNYLLLNNKIGPIWFLIALFWMRLSHWLLYNKLLFNELIVFLFSTIVATLVLLQPLRISSYQIFNFLIGFPFFTIGFLCKKQSVDIIFRKYSLLLIPFSIFSFIAFRINGSVNMNSFEYGHYALLFYIFALCGIFSLYIFFLRAKSNVIVLNISQGTLVILGLHLILIDFFKLIYKQIYHITVHSSYIDLVSGIIISMLVVCILYFPILIILKSKYSLIRFLAGKN